MVGLLVFFEGFEGFLIEFVPLVGHEHRTVFVILRLFGPSGIRKNSVRYRVNKFGFCVRIEHS